MRSFFLCLAILLALPAAAQAEESTAAIAAPLAAAAPGLDLRFDPALPTEASAAPVLQHAEPGPVGGEAKAPFSVGVKIKTRRDAGSPATWATSDQEEEPPTLADKVEDIVERSTIGVTGTYRF